MARLPEPSLLRESFGTADESEVGCLTVSMFDSHSETASTVTAVSVLAQVGRSRRGAHGLSSR